MCSFRITPDGPAVIPCLGPRSRRHSKRGSVKSTYDGEISKRITDQHLLESLSKDTRIRIKPLILHLLKKIILLLPFHLILITQATILPIQKTKIKIKIFDKGLNSQSTLHNLIGVMLTNQILMNKQRII